MPAVHQGDIGERASRILFTHPSAELYGSDRMALETVRALVGGGHTVFVVVPDHGPLIGELESTGAAVLILPVPVLRKSAMRPVNFFRLVGSVIASIPRMLRLAVRLKPSIVYVNTVVQPWWILVGRTKRARVVAHVREAERDAPYLVRAAMLAPLRAADLVIANSKATAMQLAADARSISDRTRVVYNGKEWSSYETSAVRNRVGALRLLFIGRLSPRKGPDVAIRALAELVTAGYDASLDIAGAAFTGYEWYEKDLRDLVQRLDLQRRVVFHGFVERPKELLSAADVLLVPSRIEPFGTVAAEGMAAHLPVIVSNVQGLVEIVDNERNGLVVEPGDPRALANAVERLTLDDDLRNRLAQNGAQDVRERFSRERYASEILNLVASILRGVRQ